MVILSFVGSLTFVIFSRILKINEGKLEREIVIEGNKHLALCWKCRHMLEKIEKSPKDQNLPL